MTPKSPSSESSEDRPFDELLTRHLPDLSAYVRLRVGRKLRSAESCSDIVQSVCREVLQDESSFEYRSDAAFRSWLFRAAESKIIDRHRYYSRAKRDIDRQVGSGNEQLVAAAYARILTPSKDADLQEQVLRLDAAFDELPEDYRDVILLFHVVGLSHREVAERLDRSPDAVRNLLFRAIARVGRLLEEAECKSRVAKGRGPPS